MAPLDEGLGGALEVRGLLGRGCVAAVVIWLIHSCLMVKQPRKVVLALFAITIPC
jgi:hypothetical protein